MKPAMLFLLVISMAVIAEAPDYNSSIYIRADGSRITIEYGYASPLVTDWNKDGLKDLLVGKYSLGKIEVFYNTGSDSSPVLEYQGLLQAGGSDLAVPWG